MSSSDDIEEPSPPKKPATMDNESDEDDSNPEGRFLELTVYDLSSSTTSSSSLSIISTPPTVHLSDSKRKSSMNFMHT